MVSVYWFTGMGVELCMVDKMVDRLCVCMVCTWGLICNTYHIIRVERFVSNSILFAQ